MLVLSFEVQKKMLVRDIIKLYKKKQIELEPAFQRKSVWKKKERVLLIDSIFSNYPIPSIFFYKRKVGRNVIFDIVDGKQRLESLLFFTNTIRGNGFAVEVLDDEGPSTKTWKDLSAKQQKQILNYPLNITIIQASETDKKSEENVNTILNFFVRINSTGAPLAKQEIKNARFFNNDLLKLAKKVADKYHGKFIEKKILSESASTRDKHLEIVLELMVSIYEDRILDKKAAINQSLENKKKWSVRELKKIKTQAEKTIKLIFKILPNIESTRFKQSSNFYSLAFIAYSLNKEGFGLNDSKRLKNAQSFLQRLSDQMDIISLKDKEYKKINVQQYKLALEYIKTVKSSTDSRGNRQERHKILWGLISPLFNKKDDQRIYNETQRRLLWNSTTEKRCVHKRCDVKLNFGNFSVDHILAHSKNGKTILKNAQIMCKKHNSKKGNR